MFSFNSHSKILLAVEPVDLRKNFAGLWALASETLGVEPRSDSVFVFTNRAHSRVKILAWDGTGVGSARSVSKKGRLRLAVKHRCQPLPSRSRHILHENFSKKRLRCRAVSIFSYPVSLFATHTLTFLPMTLVDCTYDFRNRLTAAGNTLYTYDAENNRLSQTTQTPTGNSTTFYTTDPHGSLLPSVLIKHNSDGTKTYYIYGIGLAYQVTFSTTGTESNPRYYHYDHLGSTLALTDAAGTETEHFDYSEYGHLTKHEILSGTTVNTPFLYVGQFGIQTDPNGLHYMRARYYNPYLMRFINADPIGFAGGSNWYAYAGNNPLGYIDPSGLLENYILKLNKDYEYTALTNTRINRSYPAFSGNGEHRNNPDSIAIPNNGPIPVGTYYIVERPQGRIAGKAVDFVWGKNKWFALYAADGKIDDKITVNGVTRGEFRLHPGSVSLGCITIANKYSFETLREELLSTEKSIIPNTNIPYYGTVTVIDPRVKAVEEGNKIRSWDILPERENLIYNNPFIPTTNYNRK